MMNKSVKLIATLGPSTRTERDLRVLKSKGVDFVRINMSHSTLEDLEYFLGLAKKVGIINDLIGEVRRQVFEKYNLPYTSD